MSGKGITLSKQSLTSGLADVVIGVRSGRAIRFPEKYVRPMGRTASGVRGITLAGEQDRVVGMICVENENEDVLVVSENGFGKRSSISGYRITNRGGKGVKTMNITDKTGKLINIKSVTDDTDLMVITKSGTIIRLEAGNIRTTGRTTQGVRLINLREGEAIASVRQWRKPITAMISLLMLKPENNDV
jgi:DNA gyrase subunit A